MSLLRQSISVKAEIQQDSLQKIFKLNKTISQESKNDIDSPSRKFVQALMAMGSAERRLNDIMHVKTMIKEKISVDCGKKIEEILFVIMI